MKTIDDRAIVQRYIEELNEAADNLNTSDKSREDCAQLADALTRRERLAQLGERVVEILAMSYDRAHDEVCYDSGWANSPKRGPQEWLIEKAARDLGLLPTPEAKP